MRRSVISKLHVALWFLITCVTPAWAETTRAAGTFVVGAEWEATYQILDSGVSGPTVLVMGCMTGDEPANCRVAAQLTHWPIVQGRLVVINGARPRPSDTRSLTRGDDSEERTAHGELREALSKFALEVKPDWIVELRESTGAGPSAPSPDGEKAAPGSRLVYSDAGAFGEARERMVEAANRGLTDSRKRFSLSHADPSDASSPRAELQYPGAHTLVLETVVTTQRVALRARQHRAMLSVLLQHAQLTEGDCQDMLAGPQSEDQLRVGIYDGPGNGRIPSAIRDIVDSAPDMTLHHLGAAEMRAEVLEQFDVVVFPGGSGSKQSKAIGEDGRDAVREFVDAGGGYIGVCAGAFLASSHFTWSLGLIDSSLFTGAREIPEVGRKPMWYRGKVASIDMDITPAGQTVFGDVKKQVVVQYHNGPILSPTPPPELEDYRVLAWFRSENGLWEPQSGTMVDTPAIVSGSFGTGRVVSVSPHPEVTQALHPIISGSIRWAAGDS